MSAAVRDVCVVGAGPAGALIARELARRGRSVALVGGPQAPSRLETLTTPPARLLLELGLGPVLAQATVARVSGTRLAWRDRDEDHEHGADGPLLISRPRLERLLGEAAAAAGVARHIDARVRAVDADGATPGTGAVRVRLGDGGMVVARLVVDAGGRRSVFRARPRALCPPLAALGFTGRAAAAPKVVTRLEALADGWVWSVRLTSGRIHGICFTDPSTLAGLDAGGRVRFLEERAGARIGPEPRYVTDAGLIAQPRIVEGAVVRIGDAALARDPISSHGLAQALGSAGRAAVAIDTILDPDGARDAAVMFLERRHEEALEDAHRATVSAYADQARFPDTAFWAARSPAHAARPLGGDEPPSAPAPAARLRVHPRATLDRQPVLEGPRIVWGRALRDPANGRSVAFLGGAKAATVRTALQEPGTPAQMARRLARAGVNDPGLVGSLWRAGILIEDRDRADGAA